MLNALLSQKTVVKGTHAWFHSAQSTFVKKQIYIGKLASFK